MTRIPTRSVLALCILAAVWAGAFAWTPHSRAQTATQADWDRPIHPGPNVEKGVLDNGLTYYVRRNTRPANRVFLRLVVKAGSILEEEDQLGVAHFLEHMAFNGTEHFESTELVNYLESIGASFGADLNAYTTFDETVYMLEIPTDKPELLEQGMLILRDWAGGITMDPEEVDKERGVILEEWRRGQGAGSRVREKLLPVVLKNSRYAERLPIGDPDIISTVSRDRIADFYRTWYRPDLMAVIAVGDADPERLRELITEHFASLPPGPEPFERPTFPVPAHDHPLAATAQDPELNSVSGQVLYKHPIRPQGTARVYRANIMDGLVTAMLNQRLTEIALQPDAPFLGAASGAQSFARSIDVFSVGVAAKENRLNQALRAVLVEMQRAALHGFRQTELDRAKQELLSAIAAAHAERDKTSSGSFTAEYTRNFLDGEPIPGIEFELNMLRNILPSVTMDEVQGAMKRLIHGDNRVVTAQGPDALPTEQELLALVAAADKTAPAPYVDALQSVRIMDPEPRPGAVASRREHPALGITEVTFQNGASVWLKPTTFKNDEIIIRAVGTPGLCLVDRGDYGDAKLVQPALTIAGYGGHKGLDLEKLLAGKQINVRTFIDDFSFGLMGTSNREDLETALQMAYLTMMEPNHDPEAFGVFMEQMAGYLENRQNLPGVKYRDALLRVNYGNHWMRRPLTVEGLQYIHLDEGLAFYRDLFGNAARLRFFVVGAFKVEDILPLLAQYVGSLPGDAATAAQSCQDPGIRFPAGTRNTTVFAGQEPKANCTMTWKARATMDEMELFRMRMATEILEIRLRNILREEMGGTYTVGVGFNQSPPYREYATTSVRFDCDPARLDSMTATVFQEIALFKAHGPSPEELAKVQELERRRVETGLERNNYWASSLSTMYLFNWEPDRILERANRIDTLTTANLREQFSEYFPENNYTVVTLLPEEAGAAYGNEPEDGDGDQEP